MKQEKRRKAKAMVTSRITIKNTSGLYVKPAGELCRTAVRFTSSVTFLIGAYEANAKSLLSVLGAQVRGGDEILLSCEGPDEEEALLAVKEAIESGLGE